jgi:hypothetical protein
MSSTTSPTTTQAQPLTLDPATFKTMLHGIVDALPYRPGAKPDDITALREAAFLAISALRLRDPLEAMLAARIIGAHFHAMHSLASAVQPALPPAPYSFATRARPSPLAV